MAYIFQMVNYNIYNYGTAQRQHHSCLHCTKYVAFELIEELLVT